MVNDMAPNLRTTGVPYTICVTVQYNKQPTELAKSMKGNMPLAYKRVHYFCFLLTLLPLCFLVDLQVSYH
jgi:hypothetical protein